MKKITALTTTLVLLAALAGSQVQVFRVPAQYPTIQQALNLAKTGTLILVERGTYIENLFWPRVDGIRLCSMEGAAVTIIHGNGLGRVVQFPPGLTRATLLEGFTLTGGAEREGAGVRIFSSPTLKHNRIVGNRGESPLENHGAGVFITSGGAPLLDQNLIQNNVLDKGLKARGAGIYVTGGAAPVIQANAILDNLCTGTYEAEGGGIYINGAAAAGATVIGNMVVRNRAASLTAARGGGVAVLGGPATLLNNTVAENGATGATEARGGGLYFGANARTGSRVINCIVVKSTAGGGIHVDGGAPFLDFNDVWQNTGGEYTGINPGANDRSVDPVFRGPMDTHLASGSPLIDAGSNMLAMAGTGTDPDGDPRFLDGNLDGLAGNAARTDIGADEYSNADLQVLGLPWPGGSILCMMSGPAGYQYYLFWSPTRMNLLVQPFGQLLIGPALGQLASGNLPALVQVPLPASPFLTGVSVHLQGLVLKPGGGPAIGNLTRRVDLTLLDLLVAIFETFSDTKMLDPKNTTAHWSRGPTKPGLFATVGYGGDGSDGDLNLTAGITLDSGTRTPGADGIVAWNYRSMFIGQNATLKLIGPYPIRLNVQGMCTIEGVIDASGANGQNAPAGLASQVGRISGGNGGPGGGAGGTANTNPGSAIGALPMELRGGPGYPRAMVCTDVNRSDNRLITVVEPNCGGGTGGNRGRPSGTVLRSGCSGNGGGHMASGIQTDYLCANIGAFGRDFGVNWITPTGAQGVDHPTAGTGGGAGGNAAITPSTNPSPANDIVAGSGGGAGGGMEVSCYETITVKSTARILSMGGNGGMGFSTVMSATTVSGGYGAGGAGGSIWLSGTSLVVDPGAQVNAQGGTGNPAFPNPTRTGNGGDGYIILRDRGGTPGIHSGATITPPHFATRTTYDPPANGKSAAYSLFYDSGSSSPRWSFDSSDPRTGNVVPGGDLLFSSPPGPGQGVNIAFQGAPDVNGQPDPNPANWFPPGAGNFETDITKLRVKGGLRYIRFRILLDLGKRMKSQPPQNPVTILSLRLRY